MQFFFGKKEDENKKLIEQVILENYNRYYRLAFRYVHNEEDAFDIVQNGACNAIKNSRTLKQPAYAQTWVYRIMMNECFRSAREPRHISYEDMQENYSLEAGRTEDTYADIDLLKAVDALPGKDKAVVVLKYFEDKKLDEIADILEENVNTVKSRLYRCIKKLRNALADDGGQTGYNLSNGIGG